MEATEFAEQTDKFGLEQMLRIETVLDDEGDELVEFFHGSAELEEYGRGVLVHVRRDVGS